MEWMVMPLKRYAEFRGRSRRKEYWMFILFQILVMAVPLALLAASMPATDAAGQPVEEPGSLFFVAMGLLVLIVLALFIPALALSIRRLHDTDRSGWWYLLSFIPFGSFVLLVFMLLDGTPGTNRFGPDPKGRGAHDVFS